jgi:restriction endonuclease S subunit
LAIQQQIVAELDGYRKVIEGARQVLANYKPTIRIDPKWQTVRIGDIARMQYGISTALNTDGKGFRTFRMNEIVDGVAVDNGSMKYAAITRDEFEKYRLRKGDILFNRTNSYEHVGRTGLFDLDDEYAFASYLIRIVADKARIVARFLNRWMNTQTFQNAVKGFASRAIGQANISASNLAMCEIPLPPLDIQREIVAGIESERVSVEANRKLVEIFEKKIQSKLAEIWGEENSRKEAQETQGRDLAKSERGSVHAR